MAAEDEDASPTLLVIAVVMLTLCLVTTAMRLTVRFKRNALGPDDYTITAATLLALGRIIIQFVSVPNGNCRHRAHLSIAEYQYVNFLTWLTQLFLFPVLCLLKISVCLLVLRIKNTPLLRYSLWSLIALLVATTLLPEIVLLAECNPVSAYWTSQHDKCWSPNVRIYSIYLQTSASVLADVVCTLLPIAVVWNLTLSLRDKIAVCGLMSLGVVSTSFACVRASSLGLAVTDLSWTYCWAAIWGDIELGFGILGANLALSRTYYDYFRKGFRSVQTYTRSHTRSGPRSGPRSVKQSNSYPLSSSLQHSSNKVFPNEAYDGTNSYGSASKNQSRVRRTSWGNSESSDEVPLDPANSGEAKLTPAPATGVDAGLGGIRRDVEFKVWDEEEAAGGPRVY